MIPYRGKVTLDKTIKYIEENTEYTWKSNLKDFDFSELRFKLDEEDISRLLIKLSNKDVDLEVLNNILNLCESLSLTLVNKENKKVFDDLLDIYLNNLDSFPENNILDKLLSAFNDKKIPVEFLRYLYKNTNLDDSYGLEIIIDYLIKARQYYVDDRALLSSGITLIDTLDNELSLGQVDEIKNLIDRKLTDDKKANGVYNIDEFTLEDIDKKMSEFELVGSQLQNLVDLTEQQITLMREESKKNGEDIASIRIQTIKQLKTEANKILKNFNAAYLELLNKERESIVNQKDILMADVEAEIQKKRLELEALASSIGQRIAIELSRIRQQSDYSIEQMQDFISNNEEVKKMFNVAEQDQAFLSRLVKLDAVQMPEIGTPVQTTGIAVPSIIVPTKEERIVDEKVNYYFNNDIPFKERFDELMAKKQEDIEKNGAIYHEKFDDLLTMILMNDAPYMFGPSGCGKTFMIEKQIAKILGIDLVTNGYISYESDIVGFNDARGVYVPTNFYRCYKFGDMVFLDELDNSISSSTIILNSFLGKGKGSYYTFPGGDKVKRHPNFRIITAGNTRGNGRTVSHNTRQKLDEAVMQRLTPIEIDYDNRIEERILENYPDWYNFAINFRNALKEIRMSGSDGPNYHGTITTRDIEAIKSYKDSNSFSDDKIMEYEVIENKDADYLGEITKELERLELDGEFTKGGSELLERFKVLCKGRKY